MWAELVLIRQVQSSFPTGDGKLASRMESLDNSPGKNSWKRQERGRKNTTKTVTQHGFHTDREAFKIKRLRCKIVIPLFGTKRSKGLQFAAVPFFLPFFSCGHRSPHHSFFQPSLKVPPRPHRNPWHRRWRRN